ncbi:hypothetical protein AX15_003733 [Amanita polypyramis BW_CC]|nr:hypothetical protein AX15_003733 [Amanita polypyramis BW_CC]
MSTIIFYDIPSVLPGKVWSPNTQKTRFTLNYKRIPFTTVWWEFNEIESKSKELGIHPTGKKADGSPLYTVPAIYDPTTKKYIANSILIAEYLDKQYPDSPRVIPDGTVALQHAYGTAFSPKFRVAYPLLFDAELKILNPPSAKYFRGKFETDGKTIEEKALKGDERREQWIKVKESLSDVAGWIQKSSGPFLGGHKPVFSDFETAGWLFFLRAVLGKDSEFWQDFLTWNDGYLGKYVDAFEQYQSYE